MTGTTTAIDDRDGSVSAKTTLMLSLHANRLPRRGKLSARAPNPFASVALCIGGSGGGGGGGDDEPAAAATGLGKTEVLERTSAPSWTRVFFFEHEAGAHTQLFVSVYDSVRLGSRSSSLQGSISSSGDGVGDGDDGGGGGVGEEKMIGVAIFDVENVFSSGRRVVVKRMRHGGCVYAQIEERNEACRGGTMTFRLRAFGFSGDAKSAASSPLMFEVSRKTRGLGGATSNVVYRSKQIRPSTGREFLWDEANVEMDAFCNGDMDCSIEIQLYAARRVGKRRLVGSFETSAGAFIKAGCTVVTGEPFILRNGQHQQDAVGFVDVTSGAVHLPAAERQHEFSLSGSSFDSASPFSPSSSPPALAPTAPPLATSPCSPTESLPSAPSCTPPRRPTFENYLDGGCELDFCVAIDFTSSNGDPKTVGSLHYTGEDSLNDYEETIVAIGGIIEKHGGSSDSAHEYPVWGFGAKYDGVVRHIFQCGPTKTCDSIDGILNAYRNVFESDLVMSGPTVFLDVIQAASSRARKRNNSDPRHLRYTVLLILTDGIVSDVDATRRKLIDVSGSSPLSVIVVGIGNADFRSMHDLANSMRSPSCARPLLTFVEFRSHQHNPSSFARASVEGLPHQAVEYFVQNGVHPPPPVRTTHQKSTSVLSVDSAVSDLSLDD